MTTSMPKVPNLETTEPDAIVDGRRVFYIWNHLTVNTPRRQDDGQLTADISMPAIPYGVLVEHVSTRTDRPCIAWIPWVDSNDGSPYWTLRSLKPLSIAEPFVCSCCGALGGIRDGRWFIGLPRL